MLLNIRRLLPVAAAAALLVSALPLAAQVPVPSDTVQLQIPAAEVAQDTIIPGRGVRDSAFAAPLIPPPARAGRAGWATATWEWEGPALAVFQGTTLLELLERVPSLTSTRASTFGQPVGIAAFGLGGGRLRVFRDGFELNPLTSATLDLHEISIVDLTGVRVERGLNETRIDLFTGRLADDRPYSMVEAGAGAPKTQLLRGLFSRPVGERVVATGAIDIVDADGFGRSSPFTRSGGVGRVSYLISPRLGAEFEFRQESIDQTDRLSGEILSPREAFIRRDLVLRARGAPLPGLLVEAFVGNSDVRPLDEDSTVFREVSVPQAGLLAAFDRGGVWAQSAARFRFGDERGYTTSNVELDLQGGVRPVAGLEFSGHARSTSGDVATAAELSGMIRVGPFVGLSAFASLTGGSRTIGTLALDTVPIEPPVVEPDTIGVHFNSITPELTSTRIGAEWALRSIRLGAAYLASDVDLVAPFGLGFDRFVPPTPTTSVQGVEAFISTPLLVRQLRADAWYTGWSDVGGRPYLPKQEWRAALQFHDVFYTGNLEPTLRLEAVGRGSSIVPSPDSAVFNAVVSGYTVLNAYVQIRIIDVQAFVLYENILNNQTALDLPRRDLSPRVLYGVRWGFRN